MTLTDTATPVTSASASSAPGAPGAPLRYRAAAEDGVAVLALEGVLDERTAPSFGARAAAAARDESGLVLDLSRLHGLDGAGLAALEELAGGLARTGRLLSLAAIRPAVLEFLRGAGAQALAPVQPTVDRAVRDMRLARSAAA